MPRKAEPAYKTENNPFSKRLREIMKERNTTQRQLADAIKMRPQTVSLYMNGQSLPDVLTLKKMADFFDVSADWLLDRKDAVKSTDGNIASVCKYTGLTTGAVEVLHGFKLASMDPHIENGIAYKAAFNWIDVDDKDSKAVLAYLSRAIETDTLAKIWVSIYKATSIDSESIRQIEAAETEEQLNTAMGEANANHINAELERYHARTEMDRYFETMIESGRRFNAAMREAEKRSYLLSMSEEGAPNGEHPETDQ